jgi:hypothetical protein
MSQEGEILVFHKDDNVDHERFVRVAQEFLELVHYETRPPAEDRKIFEDVWITPDSTNAIHFLDNSYMDCQYLWVRGPRTPEFVSKLYRLIPTDTTEDILEELSGAHNLEEGVSAVLKLGVACPNYDSQVFRAFELCLQEPPTEEPSFRRATIQAIAYRMWPENRPLLERVIRTDEDEGVRQFAQSILEEYQERAAAGR